MCLTLGKSSIFQSEKPWVYLTTELLSRLDFLRDMLAENHFDLGFFSDSWMVATMRLYFRGTARKTAVCPVIGLV